MPSASGGRETSEAKSFFFKGDTLSQPLNLRGFFLRIPTSIPQIENLLIILYYESVIVN